MPQAAQQTAGTPIESVAGGISDPFQRSLIGKIEADEKKTEEFTDKKIKQMEDTPAPKMPTLTPAPDEKNYHTDPMQTFGSAAMFLATFGSLMTRHPLTTALNSAAAVNNAVHANDAAAFKSAYDKWKVDSENAWKMAEWDQKIYKDAIDKGEAEVRMYASGHKSQAANMALEAKMTEQNHKDLLRNIENGKKATTRISRYAEDGLAEEDAKRESAGLPPLEGFERDKREMELVKEAMSKKVTPETYDWDNYKPSDRIPGTNLTYRAAKEKAEALALDPTVLTRGGIPMADKDAIMDLKAKMDNELGISGTDVLAIQAGYGASKSALNNVTKQYTMIKSFEDTAEKNMKIVESLMDKGAGTEAGPVINRWLQAGKKATGDPDVKAFDASLRAVGGEVAKINSGATGAAAATEGAIGRVEDTISGIDSPRAIRGIFDKVWRPEMKNRTGSLENMRQNLMENIKTGGNSPIGGEDRVKVTDPDGNPHTIDASELDEALSHGWKKR